MNRMNFRSLTPLALATGLICSPAAHALVSDGARLSGGSGTDWSSDLGPGYSYPISAVQGHVGAGYTTPQKPDNYYFNGESLQNGSYYNSPDYLGGSMQVDIGRNGDVEGVVHHVHLDSSVPSVGVYGLGGHSAVNAYWEFEGGTVGADTTVYYAFNWQITTDMAPLAPGAYGPALTWMAAIADNADRVGQTNIAPENLSGSGYGSFNLYSSSGAGMDTSQFTFGTLNPSGSPYPGGHSAFDIWFTFSAEPITSVPITPGVPEPETYALMLAGLGVLSWVARRRRVR